MNNNLIDQLIESELSEVDAKWPDYHSNHEAYAVIKEEVEELGDVYNGCKHNLDTYWQQVTTKKQDKENMSTLLSWLKSNAKEAIQEAVQVYVTAHRAERLIKSNK